MVLVSCWRTRAKRAHLESTGYNWPIRTALGRLQRRCRATARSAVGGCRLLPRSQLARGAPSAAAERSSSSASLTQRGVCLSLDGVGCLVGNAHRQRRHPPVGVDRQLQIVPHQLALRRDEGPHRPTARHPVQALDPFRQLLLHQAEQFPRDLLSPAYQDRTGLRHGLEVVGRTAGLLLRLEVVQAEHLFDLVRHALEALGRRVQAHLQRALTRLRIVLEANRTGASGLPIRRSGFIDHCNSHARGLTPCAQSSFSRGIGWLDPIARRQIHSPYLKGKRSTWRPRVSAQAAPNGARVSYAERLRPLELPRRTSQDGTLGEPIQTG